MTNSLKPGAHVRIAADATWGWTRGTLRDSLQRRGSTETRGPWTGVVVSGPDRDGDYMVELDRTAELVYAHRNYVTGVNPHPIPVGTAVEVAAHAAAADGGTVMEQLAWLGIDQAGPWKGVVRTAPEGDPEGGHRVDVELEEEAITVTTLGRYIRPTGRHEGEDSGTDYYGITYAADGRGGFRVRVADATLGGIADQLRLVESVVPHGATVTGLGVNTDGDSATLYATFQAAGE